MRNINNPKIYIAGHTGMVGSSIIRVLRSKGFTNLIYRKHSDLDLIDQAAVKDFFLKEKPDQVYLSAAKVGGIQANNVYPADFLYQNLMIQTNVIDAAFQNNVKKLLFLGSSCIYPNNANQPMREDQLLSGKLEPTNEPYAIAKIAGIKMCESYNAQYKRNYISLMPTNTFGSGDNYSLKNSHFIPSILRKIYIAKKNNRSHINLWGTGKPKREVIHVDDLASAVVHFMNIKTQHSLINIGSSKEFSIKAYANMILKILNINLKIKFDNNKKYDGVYSKVLDTKIAKKYGWKPNISFDEAILNTYKDLEKNYKFIRDK